MGNKDLEEIEKKMEKAELVGINYTSSSMLMLLILVDDFTIHFKFHGSRYILLYM